MAGGLANLLRSKSAYNVLEDVQHFVTQLDDAGQGIANTAVKSIIATAPEDTGIDVAAVSGSVSSIFAIPILLCGIIAIDAIVILLWWIRGIASKIPFIHSAFTTPIDYTILAIGSMVEPLNELIDNTMAAFGSAVHSLFSFLLTSHSVPTKADMHHNIAAYTNPLHANTSNLDKRLAKLEDEIASQHAQVQTQVHGIYTLLDEINTHVNKLDTKVRIMENDLAKAVKAIELNAYHIQEEAKQIVKLDHIANVHGSKLRVLHDDVAALDAAVFGLNVRLTHDEALLEPAAEAASSLGPLGPLVGLGQDGIECLVKIGRDCGRSNMEPEIGGCVISNFTRMVSKFPKVLPV